jgi:hypothetical protein
MDRHIMDRHIVKDSLPADGAELAGHADPTDSEGSIHATRDGAKEMVALLRCLFIPSSVCACPEMEGPLEAEQMMGFLGAARSAW